MNSFNSPITPLYWTNNDPLMGHWEVFMFKKTINFSDLKKDPSLVSEMEDGQVFQVFHRGQDVKVMMTQEYFFNLMARLEKAEGSGKRTNYDPDKMMEDFNKKMRKLDDLIGKAEHKEEKIG